MALRRGMPSSCRRAWDNPIILERGCSTDSEFDDLGAGTPDSPKTLRRKGVVLPTENVFKAARQDRKSEMYATRDSPGSQDHVGCMRLAPLFDDNGVVVDSTPSHWALAACGAASHETVELDDWRLGVGLTTRQKAHNAKLVLIRDRSRVNKQISDAQRQHRMCSLDIQKTRHRRLLLQPLQVGEEEDMVHLVGIVEHGDDYEIHNMLLRRQVRLKKNESTKLFQNAADKIKLGLVMGNKSKRSVTKDEERHDMRRIRSKEIHQSWISNERRQSTQMMRDSDAAEKTGPDIGGQGGISKTQGNKLKNMFAYYTQRVNGGEKERMQRSTWFKFVHHCGLFVAEEDEPTITFADGSRVFRFFAEQSDGLNPPALTCASWFAALQRLLRAPQFWRMQSKFVATLFAKYLKRCESRIETIGKPCGLDRHMTSDFVRLSSEAPKTPSPSPAGVSLALPAQRPVLPSAPAPLTSRPKFRQLSGVSEQSVAPAEKLSPRSGTQDSPQATDSGGSFVKPGCRLKGKPVDPRSQASSMKAKTLGILGCQADLAEEQMCEPEVMLLFHEYAKPFRELFVHFSRDVVPKTKEYQKPMDIEEFATDLVTLDSEVDYEYDSSDDDNPNMPHVSSREDMMLARQRPLSARPLRARRAQSKNTSTPFSSAGSRKIKVSDASDSDTDMPPGRPSPVARGRSQSFSSFGEDHVTNRQKRDNRPRTTRRRPTRMRRENFEAMLRSLGLFPEIVQAHSLKQHINLSLARRGVTQLSYAAFAEVLCRIAFVYLDLYGNSVQKAASSPCKFLWLLAMLRSRCRSHGRQLGLPTGLSGTGSASGVMWQQRKIKFLDGNKLRKLIFWRIFDASAGSLMSSESFYAPVGVPILGSPWPMRAFEERN